MTEHMLFPLLLTFIIYLLFLFIQKKTQQAWLNPLIFSSLAIMLILVIFNIPMETYQEGNKMLNALIAPATVSLAIPLYQNRQYLKKIPKTLIFTTFLSALVHAALMFLSYHLFKLNRMMAASLFPKSVTTAIAMDISLALGGTPNLTVAMVVITGVLGTSMADVLNKIFHIESPIAQGLALGSASHAVGTSKASEMGEVQASMSALALILTGLWTVIISLFIS